MSQVINVNGETFQAEVLDSEIPVIVDFYASWCPPCNMLAPMLERFAVEFDGRIKFVKINSDDEPSLSESFNVTGLPTVVFIEDGQHAGQFAGLPHEEALRDELNKWIEPRTTSSNS